MSENVLYPSFPPKAGETGGEHTKTGESQLAPDGGGPHDPGMEARLSVLEEIAASTKEALTEIKADLRAIRGKQEDDFRANTKSLSAAVLKLYLAGFAAVVAILGVMAKGFHWL